MKTLALSIGDGLNGTPIPILVPSGIPTGGLSTVGTNFIQLVFTIFFVVAIIAAIILIMYAGIQWILSQGDKAKVQSARDRITYVIIGLVVIMFSFVIVRFVISLFGGNPGFFLSF